MLEVETKYELDDKAALIARLTQTGAVTGDTQRHADTYYRHPCRDFVKTNEALRIRSIDSVASVTYKGPKMAVGDSALKARKEIEWCLAPGDADGSNMEQLLLTLGFTAVTTVRKERQSFAWPESDSVHVGFTLTIDEVQQVGLFAEIELLIPDASSADVQATDVQAAGQRIDSLAQRLGLVKSVRQSYLTMLLEKTGQSR